MNGISHCHVEGREFTMTTSGLAAMLIAQYILNDGAVPPQQANSTFDQKAKNDSTEMDRGAIWNSRGVSPVAKDPYFDHSMDGVYLGYAELKVPSVSPSISEFPVIVSFNTSAKHKVYASITFQNFGETIALEKQIWQSVYTSDVKATARKGNSNILDITFPFEADMVKNITPLTNEGKKFRFTLTGDFQISDGRFIDFDNSMSSGFNPALEGELKLFRMYESPGFQGIWTSGFTDHMTAGSDSADLYVPLNLIVRSSNKESYSTQNYFTMLGNLELLNNTKTTSKNILIHQDSFGPNSRFDFHFDLDMKKTDVLEGKFWYNQTTDGKDHSSYNYNYTFDRVGSGGKKFAVKKVTPKLVLLNKAKKKVTFTVKGKGITPGTMVHFSNPSLEITEIKYVSKKSLKVTAQTTAAIKKGQAIGVRLVNPDNKQATKAGAFKTK